jgi:hypothetical protein
MNNTRHLLSRTAMVLGLLGGALAASAGSYAAESASSDVLARYQQERALCLNGESNQDRATCLREAGAALVEARRGGLNDDPTQFGRNAIQRCERLPGEDRLACEIRMQGFGTTTGSVASGGIYRELIIEEVAPPVAARLPNDTRP